MRYCRLPSGRFEPKTFQMTSRCQGSGMNGFPAHSPLVCLREVKTFTAFWAALVSKPSGGLREERLFLLVASTRHLDLRTINRRHPQLAEIRREHGVLHTLRVRTPNPHPQSTGGFDEWSIRLRKPWCPPRYLPPARLLCFIQVRWGVAQWASRLWLMLPCLPALRIALECPIQLQDLRGLPGATHAKPQSLPALTDLWSCAFD